MQINTVLQLCSRVHAVWLYTVKTKGEKIMQNTFNYWLIIHALPIIAHTHTVHVFTEQVNMYLLDCLSVKSRNLCYMSRSKEILESSKHKQLRCKYGKLNLRTGGYILLLQSFFSFPLCPRLRLSADNPPKKLSMEGFFSSSSSTSLLTQP